MPYLLLTIAIVAEVVATTALKSSDGFRHFLPSMLVVAGYGLSFYLLSLVVRSLPLGLVYAVWSGIGSVLVLISGWLIFKQAIDLAGLVGIFFIIAGVVILNSFSNSLPH